MWLIAFLPLFLTTMLAACTSAPATTAPVQTSVTGATPSLPSGLPTSTSTVKRSNGGAVFVIMLENTERSTMLARMPYLTGLAKANAQASQLFAITHPSQPNRFADTSGSTQSVTDDDTHVVSATNIADAIEAAGMDWKLYAEDLPSPCNSHNVGAYAGYHNWATYYADIVSNPTRCAAHNVPLKQLTADIANNAVPSFVWIEPNQRDNGHDTDAAYADGWLAGFLPVIMNSAAFKNDGRLIITFDEGETNAGCCGRAAGGNVGLVALSQNGPQGYMDSRNVDMYSFERTIGDLLGVTVPGAGASAPTLANLFASPTPAAADTGVAIGVWGGLPGDAAPFDAYNSAVGVAPAVLHFFEDWRYTFNAADFDFIYARGAMPLMSWDAADWSHSGTDSRYALAKIGAGKFDAYLTAWAQDAAAYGKRFYLRPAYEMNGDSNNWGMGVNGNTPAQYIAMWRHLHDIFAAANATNVQWVWSPNCSSVQGVRGYTDLYPGDAYVDWIAIDCYNWGTSKAKVSWQDPVTLFADDYATLTGMTDKPLMIAETASSERGGSKAAWISQLQSALVMNFPRVQCLLWFDQNKEADWQVDTSATALAAWRALVRSPAMQGRLP